MVQVFTIISAFLIGWLHPSTKDHSIYITVFEIRLPDMPGKKGSILIKAFTDDLQNALFQRDDQVKISADPCSNQNVLNDYVIEHFQMKGGQKEIGLESKGCQQLGDTHWLFFDFTWSNSFQNLSIDAQWFTELFPTQTNIIKVSRKEMNYFDRLSKEKSFTRIDLQ